MKKFVFRPNRKNSHQRDDQRSNRHEPPKPSKGNRYEKEPTNAVSKSQ